MGLRGPHHAPAALPPGKTRYPLYRRLGGPQGWSGRVRKISPQPGFELLTVQPVASRCTELSHRGSLIIRHTRKSRKGDVIDNSPKKPATVLLLVFSPWAGLGRDQSSVRRLVWLWYAASWANSLG